MNFAKSMPNFPMWGIGVLAKNQVKVYTVNKSVVEAFPWLAGHRQPNYPIGVTWDSVAGVYLEDLNAAAVSLTVGSGSYNTKDHEVGHAIDSHMRLSESVKFRDAWAADYSKLGSDYFGYQGAGYRETFAESFARYFGGDASMRSEWPTLFNYMNELNKCMADTGKGC